MSSHILEHRFLGTGHREHASSIPGGAAELASAADFLREDVQFLERTVSGDR